MKNSKREAGCARLTSFLRRGIACEVVRRNRYLDVGDWGHGRVAAVAHRDPRSTAGVLIHEIAEYVLCVFQGISARQVDQDDLRVLSGRKKRNQVCYWKAHCVALKVEKLITDALGLDWQEHDNNVEAAFKQQEAMMGGSRKASGKKSKGMKGLAEKMKGKK